MTSLRSACGGRCHSCGGERCTPPAAFMQEASRIEKENAQLTAEAEAQHAARLDEVQEANAAAVAAARVEWEAECAQARDAHERLTAAILVEFQAENEKKRQRNEELTVQRREEWTAAVEASRREWSAACKAARVAFDSDLREAEEHNTRIQPQVRHGSAIAPPMAALLTCAVHEASAVCSLQPGTQPCTSAAVTNHQQRAERVGPDENNRLEFGPFGVLGVGCVHCVGSVLPPRIICGCFASAGGPACDYPCGCTECGIVVQMHPISQEEIRNDSGPGGQDCGGGTAEGGRLPHCASRVRGARRSRRELHPRHAEPPPRRRDECPLRRPCRRVPRARVHPCAGAAARAQRLSAVARARLAHTRPACRRRRRAGTGVHAGGAEADPGHTVRARCGRRLPHGWRNPYDADDTGSATSSRYFRSLLELEQSLMWVTGRPSQHGMDLAGAVLHSDCSMGTVCGTGAVRCGTGQRAMVCMYV